MLFSGGWLVEQLEPLDILMGWGFYIVTLLLLDVVKMIVLAIEDYFDGESSTSAVTGRNAFSCGQCCGLLGGASATSKVKGSTIGAGGKGSTRLTSAEVASVHKS